MKISAIIRARNRVSWRWKSRRNKRQEDLRADAARLAANPEYQAEIRAVREELDDARHIG